MNTYISKYDPSMLACDKKSIIGDWLEPLKRSAPCCGALQRFNQQCCSFPNDHNFQRLERT